MPTLSKEAEAKICNVLERIASMVANGDSPNQAIIKAAQETPLPATHLRLVVNAYNNGSSTNHRLASDDPVEKAADFALADPIAVFEAIYPETTKTASQIEYENCISAEYDLEPTWSGVDDSQPNNRLLEKAAFCINAIGDTIKESSYARDPARFIKKANNLIKDLKNRRQDAYVFLQNMADEVSNNYGNAYHYFKQAGVEVFEDVKDNCVAFYGESILPIFNKLATELKLPAVIPVEKKNPLDDEPRRKKKRITRGGMNRNASPYKDVEACAKSAQAYVKACEDVFEFEKKAFQYHLELERALAGIEAEPVPADNTLSVMRRLAGEKRANLASPLAAGLSFSVGSSTGKSIMDELEMSNKEKLKSKMLNEITDPNHETAIRSIRAQAALHGLLNSPSFEGENPHHVADWFNKITTMAPRLTEQPLALEALMRRYTAQGQADTHDLDQLMGMETKMKQRDENKSPQNKSTNDK